MSLSAPARPISSAHALPTAERVAALRGLLAEKFPVTELRPSGLLPTGLAAFDAAEGGLRRGALTELAGPPGSGGLFLGAALAMLRRTRGFGALVDAGRSFDPQGADPRALRRLLWVRCGDAQQAVKAADLLLRDGNLPLLLVDFQRVPQRELRRIPASTWHRFQRLVEQTGTAFVVLSTTPIVEGAQVRIAVKNHWSLAAMRRRRGSLLADLEAQIFVRRALSAAPIQERRIA